jgi:HD superfamily phosphohydrolase
LNTKIINDPVHGFITISQSLILKVIEHSYFQRLKRISQTGLSSFVYPGAHHTRFHHAIGAMHLMQLSLQTLKNKGVQISKEEETAALLAILLHDIGHGPFSHALESSILEGVHHEHISLFYFESLNRKFGGKLDLAIKMFKDEYPRKFFNQLISSQLDVDRLDYLKRDSFFTGVSEGNIGSERIITMMNVVDDELVIEQKGIYSIEKYLTSRMFMYWQVYFHKTSTSAEFILIKIFKRAKELIKKGENLSSSKRFNYFLRQDIFQLNEEVVENFTLLDDTDVFAAIKEWQFHNDIILSKLCYMLVNRKLPKSSISTTKLSSIELDEYCNKVEKKFKIDDGTYFINQKELKVTPYDCNNKPIKLLTKKNKIVLLHEAENQMLTSSLIIATSRYHLMIPKEIL